MEENQKRRQPRLEKQPPKKISDAPPMSSKIIRKESGQEVRQYPAHVGYHGSGEESKLNPEE